MSEHQTISYTCNLRTFADTIEPCVKDALICTYDEVLDIVMKLEVGAPLNFNPDWPVRTTEAYPKSVAPLIVPAFDTGTPSPYSFLTPETPATTVSAPTSGAATPPTSTSAAESSSTSLPAFAPGSLGVRELSWGFEESWKPGVVFNTRIESATKPTWQESMQHRRCIPSRSCFLRDTSRRNLSLAQNRKAHQTPIRILRFWRGYYLHRLHLARKHLFHGND